MNLELTDKIAIVTAASQGFGRAIAEGLLREGCRVAICARNRERLEQTAHELADRAGLKDSDDRLIATAADVSRAADCERLVRDVVQRWGGVDILVTNTGGPSPGAFDAIADSDWEAALQNTLLNVARLVRRCVPSMRERGGGRIVNIASVSAKQPIDGLVLSNALRPAIVGLAKTLAVELGPAGILVNTVCPGSHDTDRLRELAEARARKNDTSVRREYELMAANSPLGRIGRAEELADVVLFLCSARAGYVTGQAIVVDGGSYRGLA